MVIDTTPKDEIIPLRKDNEKLFPVTTDKFY